VSDDDPVFTTPTGTRIEYSNVYHRVLTPAMRKAGIDWGAFHRLRHTCGTVMKRKGASDSQIQLWLGHHDPGFTARTYIHLDSRDLPDPTLFDSFLAPEGGNKGATGATRSTETDQDQDAEEAAR
jgi:integrase